MHLPLDIKLLMCSFFTKLPLCNTITRLLARSHLPHCNESPEGDYDDGREGQTELKDQQKPPLCTGTALRFHVTVVRHITNQV